MSLESPEPRIRRHPARGVEIAYDEAGPADGVPVILLHGGGQTRGAWGGALMEGARRGFRMLSVDLRGHGDSGWAGDGDYTTAAHVADLHTLIETLDQAPFIVGASLGGLVGLMHAGEGGRLAGLVLVDIAHHVEESGAARIQAFMRSAPNGFSSLDEAADAVAGFLPHRPRPKDTSGLMKNLRLRDGRYHWHWDPQMLTGRGPREPERMRRAAEALTVPTLLIRGRLSDVLSPEGARDFLAIAPHAEFADIAGADHMVAGDRNDAFNAATFEFLERHSGRG
jgi:pimeloyl-ACP methyl ester carboxylesterase